MSVSLPKAPEVIQQQWITFDLTGKRHLLDDQATALADGREASQASRKRLVAQTGEFRKTTTEDPNSRLAKATSLIKLYQDEIDNLTRRCKAAEGAFSEAYKVFNSIPDPTPFFNTLNEEKLRAQRLGEVELENKRLRDELAECQSEFREIQNQEVTIRRLENQLRESQEQLAEEINSHQDERDAAERDLKALNLFKEQIIEKDGQISQLQQEMKRIVKSNQDSQATLLNLKATCDAQLAAKQAEIALLTSELEKRTSFSSSSSNNNNSSQQQNSIGSNYTIPPTNFTAELELKLAQQEIEVVRLKHQVSEIEQNNLVEKQALESNISQLKEQLNVERAEKESTRTSRPSEEEYIRLVKELETLKALVGNDSTVNGSVISGVNDGNKTIEQGLSEKARRLESEAIRLRAHTTELEAETSQLKKDLSNSTEEIVRMRSLIDRLEEQLSHESATTTTTTTTASAAAATTINSSSPTILPLSPRGNMNEPQTPQANSSAAAVLEIVCGQRDRFRTRIVELEAEKSRVMEALERSDADVHRLKTDNLKLYERIKFLQTFDELHRENNNSNNYNSSYSTSTTNSHGNRQRFEAASGDVERRYGQIYDETMNPFAVFNKKEKDTRYKQLGVAERLLLRSTNFFMSNRYTRMILFGYLVSLHALVFVILYILANSPC